MANSLRHVFQVNSETCMIFLRDTVHRFLEAEAKSRGEIFQNSLWCSLFYSKFDLLKFNQNCEDVLDYII